MRNGDRNLKILLAVLGAVLLVGLLFSGAMMGPGMMGPGMMWGYGSGAAPIAGSWGISMAVGTLAMLAFWAALIVGIILLVRWAFGQGSPTLTPAESGDAVAVLKRRYAAGEIDKTTYERMKDELAA